MKCLVTGGAGFIGSHLVDRLLADGYPVLVLDDFSTGSRSNLEFALQSDTHSNKLQVVDGDVRNTETCNQATRNITHVFHLAALSSVPTSLRSPELTKEINTVGFQNLLGACVKNGVNRFVYASSSAVYGDSGNSKNTEDQQCRPNSPYAKSKYANERFATKAASENNIRCAGLRYFNVYGTRQKADTDDAPVIANWLQAIVKNETIPIFGDGEIIRDYLHVSDAVNANVLAAQAEEKNTVVNIGSGHSISLNDLCHTMLEVYKGMGRDYSGAVEYLSPRQGDIISSAAKIDKARDKLGYSPKMSIEEGLRQVFTSAL